MPPIVFDKPTMEKMRLDSIQADKEDRLLAYRVACKFCHAKAREVCEGPGVWDGTKPIGVHMCRLKDAIPHPRPARYWWITAHEDFMAGRRILQPGFDTDL